MDKKITIKAQFVNRSGKPFKGENYTVKLYDWDTFSNDFLGSDTLDKNGIGYITFGLKDMNSLDSFNELNPDFYFILFHKEKEVGRSKIKPNFNLQKNNSDEVVDLGEIEINI